MLGIFGKKCPKCNGKNINVVRPNLFTKWVDVSLRLPTLGIRREAKNLNVCTNCGFSWDDR